MEERGQEAAPSTKILSEQLPPAHPDITKIEGMIQEGAQGHPGQHLEFPDQIRDADGKVVVAKPDATLSKEQIRLLEQEPPGNASRWKAGILKYFMSKERAA